MTAGPINILVLEGDGIGPEITAATLAVLAAAERAFALKFTLETASIGWAAHKRDGTTFPAAVEEKAKAADGVLLGPVSHNEYPPVAEGGRPSKHRRWRWRTMARSVITGCPAFAGHDEREFAVP